jgi:hypothetical protein
LLADEDEIRAFALECLREHLARRDEIGPGCRRVRHQDGAVGAHRERLSECRTRAFWAHRDDDHLALARALPEPQPLLERVCVELVQRAFATSVETLRLRVDPLGRSRIGDLLHADDDLHRARAYRRPDGRRPLPQDAQCLAQSARDVC